MSAPVWTGDLADNCVLKTQDGYIAHAEAMDSGKNEHWCCIVTIGDRPMMRTVYHSAEDGIWPTRGDLARRLCKMAIDADRWKRRVQND